MDTGLYQGLAILHATFMQASISRLAAACMTGRRGRREQAVPSDGLVARFGLA